LPGNRLGLQDMLSNVQELVDGTYEVGGMVGGNIIRSAYYGQPETELRSSSRSELPRLDNEGNPTKSATVGFRVCISAAISTSPDELIIIKETLQRTSAEEATKQAEAIRKDKEARQLAEKKRLAEAAEKTRLADEAKRRQEASSVPTSSTRAGAFENNLGMKFVPVPGTKVLFSIWDTRVKDYEAFASATGRSVDKPDFPQTPNDPVVNVSWEDAKAFCEWLTTKERGSGKIGPQQTYRLPTDAEWSVAVGLPVESGITPSEKSEKISAYYPWGTQWPPPKGSGNYNPSVGVDTFENTSPVGSFEANRYGLYDMGGNVWQWCEDLKGVTESFRAVRGGAGLNEVREDFKDGSESFRVVRGGAWLNEDREDMNSSYRGDGNPEDRVTYRGFRCVLVSDGGL